MWASMNHESYVLLVDAHTEGCGGDNNIVPWSTGNPFVLALCPLRSAQACVIRCCANVHPSNDHGVYHHGSGGDDNDIGDDDNDDDDGGSGSSGDGGDR